MAGRLVSQRVVLAGDETIQSNGNADMSQIFIRDMRTGRLR